jgi:triacylglycerol lipase
MRTTALRAPIVLAHGLFGFGRVCCGPLILASYFRGIPEMLRAMGHRVLVTRVHPTAGVRRRAKRLGERIQAVFPDEPVHILGHSLGGLDARELLRDPSWHGRVLSVTTIAAPHLGSTMASLSKKRFGPVFRLLRAIGWDIEAVTDMTPDRARRWHEETPVPEGVPCFSVAGDPRPQDVCFLLRRLHSVMLRFEGPNDGIVSVESARAFGTPLDPWPVDHFQQTNQWTGFSAHKMPQKIRDSYLAVIENLRGCDATAGRALAG